MIGRVLSELADIANCVSSDLHLMHLQYVGVEFDTMHKSVLKEYYEQSAEDYDTWAEAALMFDDAKIQNPALSAERLQYQTYQCERLDRNTAIGKTKELLTAYCEAISLVHKGLKDKDCYKCIGVVNTLEDRISYWSKELCYFNERRF